jgi:predicted DNA-binding WGR domain protein
MLMLNLHRRDPARNMARFYTVRLHRDLLDGWTVIPEWGRIGRAGRVRIDLHDGLEPARAAAERLRLVKRRRGYRER